MGFEGSPAATAVLGLKGFCLLAAEEIGGELVQLVETTAERAHCPTCARRAEPKERPLVRVRDVPSGGRPVVTVWKKRVWRCLVGDCPTGSWTERSEEIRPRASLTERARKEIVRRVGRDGHTVAEVARDFGVSWDTAMNVVRELGTPLVDDPLRIGDVSALGIDESSFRAGSATSRTEYVTGFTDLDRHVLLDITEDGKGDVVRSWLGSFDADWLGEITAVAIDPHRGYKGGLHPLLDGATVVVDRFHAIRLGNDHLDDTRRRVQQEGTATAVTRATPSTACAGSSWSRTSG